MIFFLPVSALQDPQVLSLHIDARQANRGVIHVEETIPTKAGKVAFYFPKWIPGEHSPTGTIQALTNLHFRGDKGDLSWRRDPVDMFKFWVNVPSGQASVSVSFDNLTEPFDTYAENFARIKFTRLAMSPVMDSDKVFVRPTLVPPDGWQIRTALVAPAGSGNGIHFQPVSFRDLLDSPILIGKFVQTVNLGSIHGSAMRFNVFADDNSKLPDSVTSSLKNIPGEYEAVFGSRHFRHYDFLVTRSNQGGWDGLEHIESSEDGTGLDDYKDDPVGFGYLFAHECFHSWNGKYRRPAGLTTADFLQPMKGELLWVYEGLTQYYGFVMAARLGLISKDDLADVIAGYYNMLDTEPARRWQSVADSAIGAQLSYHRPDKWTRSARRPDFYFETLLVWLEADCLIRKGTGGKKSLDDFCCLFAGNNTNAPAVKPYDAEEIYKLLGEVYTYDWRKFFDARLYSVTPHAPSNGIAMAGYAMTYNSTPNAFKNNFVIGSFLFARCGITVDNDGNVVDLDPSGPAFKAGLSIGDSITKVAGDKFSYDAFAQAVTGSTGAVTVSAKRNDQERSITIKCKGGAIIPHLKRTDGPDLLARIASPKAKRS